MSNGPVIIPPVSLPLNQSECMCESMQEVIDNIHSPVPTSCSTDAECTGVECLIYLDPNNVLVLEDEFEICQEPPGVLVLLRTSDGTPIFDHYFTGSSNEAFNISSLLHVDLFVSVVPGNYSMTVSVSDGVTFSPTTPLLH